MKVESIVTPLGPAELAARTASVVDAAAVAGRALGLDVRAPVVLHDVFSVVVHLAPAPVVARVPVVMAPGHDIAAQLVRQQRELDVVAWLAARGVPVVAPSPGVPRAPVRQGERSMTFWELVEVAADHAPYAATDSAVTAELHAALRDHPTAALPFLSPVTRSVPSGLAFLAAHPGLLAPADLDRARREWAVLEPVLSSHERFAAAFPHASVQTLHGDAPSYNVIRTTSGLRFADFEDVTLGPIEWDLAGCTPEDAHGYDAAADRLGLCPHDPEVLRVMNTARMLQVVTAFALVPQLPLLASGLPPALDAWRAMPFAGGLG
ncbi:MAG: phosphotransferase [Myxococcota bacterium]